MMLLPSLITFGLLVSASAGPLLFQPHDQLSVSKQTCKSGLECQDNDTCCEVKSGGWSCCPFKNAACCKDKLHCCPGGTQCNLTSQHCEKPNQVYPIRLTSLSKATKVKSIVCPDKRSDCPDSSTCCRLASGDYGCCPLLDATCCSDNIHCCPRGYTCDVQSGSCNKGLISVPWVKKIPAKTKIIQCPDGKTECPENNTCCPHGPGRYGCCPWPNAECCPDYVHCCPQGFKCHRASQSCSNGSATYPWRKQNPPIRSITCPDGATSCPGDSTCCQLTSGQYGCCPLPNATCCSDHIHCCPDGYMCYPSEGKCSKHTMLIPMVEVVQHKIVCGDGTTICPFGAHCCRVGESEYKCCPAGHRCSDKECQKYQPSLTHPTVVIQETNTIVKGVHCPDGKQVCPDETTCCQMSTGAYGCCPIPDANCCPDHIHCCPHDQKCDIKTGACVKGDKTFPLLKKFAAKFSDVVCPDGKGTCPTGSTCCKLASGKYGCCPLPNATCCDDHVHCCPNGYTCDSAQSTCNKGALFVPMAKKTPAKSVVTETLSVSNIICPDRETVCDESSTCCKLKSGDYGCCPFKKAICCTDQEHCCPEGYHCDREKEACLRSPLPMLKQSSSVSVVICPNKQTCPNSNTCCRLASGGYGCCPRPNAVCCADHTHCCPNGYTCNLKAGTCTKGALSLPWLEKTGATVKDVVCPDGSSTCPDNNTCCKLASGQYGCCPLPRATCCSDHTHCCPEGYTCHPSEGTCTKGTVSIPWMKKTSGIRRVKRVICPDGSSSCPNDNTCCKLASGQYGCCPMPRATCCSDHTHCCPQGYTCHPSKGTCSKGTVSIPWLEKTSAIKNLKNVISTIKRRQCPGVVMCPSDHSTCCRDKHGRYRCCRYEHATCCSDGLHCCPKGEKCYSMPNGDVTCIPKSLKEVGDVKARVGYIMCPGRVYQCPDSNTCCKTATGAYSCCPLPHAVCCPDYLHCCPNGYTCAGKGQCRKEGEETIAWMTKRPALRTRSQDMQEQATQLLQTLPEGKSTLVGNVVCPDGASQCPSGNTCCKLASGQYGCCPLPNAECCSDHVHCCPNGYSCDVSAGTCSKGGSTLKWLPKSPATPLNGVVCPDGASQCPSGNTCCKLASGQYGCCPLPNAECCSDHVHCCPNGYTCDISAGTCSKGVSTLKWLQKSPATAISVNGVVCPDGASQCPNGNTCCKLASGQYGCCPLPQAVCCSDYVHCCPNGYTCDVSSGKCNKGLESIPWVEKVSAESVGLSVLAKLSSKVSVRSVLCPDKQGTCPDGNTCCLLASGKYGCCPLPQATCCSDHTHCCPHGTTCDTAAGTCNKGDLSLPWYEKSPATPVESVVCPDGASQCPNGNTCCKLASGQYGCCPLPQAVCCSDHVHCCPNGYTCDVSSGKCNKALESIPWVEKVSAESVGLSVLAKLSSKVSVRSVLCPDKQGTCPDGNTCCLLASGKYGCCPLPLATCCSDHTHCCPHGTTCDTAAGTCNKGDLSLISWYEKSPATPVESVVCPDGASQCPSGNTCCKLASGQYGCCPLPNAECCSDHVHCCPNGYTCDVSAGTCSKGVSTLKWLPKSPATPLNGVVCPDGASQCPSGNTCCKLASGQYGCCPLPNAECCSDHVHCCPNGYTCDVSAGTCSKGALSLPWVNKMASMKKTDGASLSAVICPDGASECPNGNTCCPMQGGSYGCCPLPMAVCCADKLHCCPNGYTCDAGAGTCLRAGKIIAWFTKTEAKVKNVICPGGGATCPNDNTCCKLASGQYGCCPLPRATCCSDHTHCCPEGYTCHPSEGTCSKSPVSLPWLTHELAVGSIICPDKQGTCPDGNTCCLLASGKYGCCPLARATCCSDHTHCCPHGTTCDTAAGTCNQGTLLLPWLEKIATTPLNGVVCPDGASECPNGNTCCKLASGQYGCCPLPQAVCCSDHVHCCPNGYTCDVSSGKCNKSFQSIPWVKKCFAKNIEYSP